MASTKKTKKSKGVTLSLAEFLGDTPASGGNVVYAPPKKQMSSWADEVEEDDFITAKERIVLPSAPRASRGPGIDENLIPTTPPFQANIGNLHYEIEEEDIFKFFENLEILELKLPRDHVTNRIKGFGFIIFGSRQDLIDALVMNEGMLRGRPVRVALLSGENNREGGGGSRREYRDRPPAEDEGVDNWRSMAGATVRENAPSSFSQSDRRGPERGDRSFRNNQDENSEEISQWRAQPRPRQIEYSRRPDHTHSADFRRPADSDFRRGGPPDHTHSEDYNPRNRSPSPDFIRPATTVRPQIIRKEREEIIAAPSSPPKTRKKLILAPRTVTAESVSIETTVRSSIFGDAKPVDTLKREQEIEERKGEENKGGVVSPPRRTHSQSSNQSIEKPDSDPEDERDFKQNLQNNSQRGRSYDNRPRHERPHRGNYSAPRRPLNENPRKPTVDPDGFSVMSSKVTPPVVMTTMERSISPPSLINKFAALNSDED